MYFGYPSSIENFGLKPKRFLALSILSVPRSGATIENDYDYAKLYKMFDPSKEYELIKSEYPGVDKGDLIENFIDAIKNDKEPQISKKEIFNSMSICFAIEESMQTGKIKKVQYLY